MHIISMIPKLTRIIMIRHRNIIAIGPSGLFILLEQLDHNLNSAALISTSKDSIVIQMVIPDFPTVNIYAPQG
jgi:hypothetical protein